VSRLGEAGHMPPKAVLTRRARAGSGARRTGNLCQASVPDPLELFKCTLCLLWKDPQRVLPKRSEAPKRAAAAKRRAVSAAEGWETLT
jgi:hypothetical protein